MVYFLTAEQVAPVMWDKAGYNKTHHGPQHQPRKQRPTYVGGTNDVCQPYRDRSKRIEVNTWRGSGFGDAGTNPNPNPAL